MVGSLRSPTHHSTRAIQDQGRIAQILVRLVGKQEVIRLLPACPSSARNQSSNGRENIIRCAALLRDPCASPAAQERSTPAE
jgi:hypothetical protein